MTISRFKSYFERAVSPVCQVAGVFMYHRIANEPYDPWSLCVTPDNFAQHLAVLRRNTDVVDLNDVVPNTMRRMSPKIRTAITFDDGYRDNITNALPILEEFDAPATIFVVSKTLGSVREFWWDALERCFFWPASLPSELTIDINGQEKHWHLTPDDAMSPLSMKGWRADVEKPVSRRQTVFLDLWQTVMPLEDDEKHKVLDQLMTWAGVDTAAPEERQPMSADELAELAKHPLITIGCHTDSHATLPSLSVDRQRHEIEEGRKLIENVIGKRVTRFAYPYGHHNDATSEIVRDLGFDVVCTCNASPVTPLSSAQSLPRLQALDEDGGAFAQRNRRRIPQFV